MNDLTQALVATIESTHPQFEDPEDLAADMAAIGPSMLAPASPGNQLRSILKPRYWYWKVKIFIFTCRIRLARHTSR